MNIRTIASRYAATDWNSPKLKAFDYALSIATVGYGLHVGSPLVVVAGAAGAAATWWGLNARIVRGVQGAMRRRARN
ncbi:hypothetical protein BHAOGJBA_1141 [Methylobacterium hispanicum]|uniref:Uncharacterized protein n=1 Tax=Methylobacterium hispanicum TaxID=270350 RepID=A0AAV4ZGS6_9HYPH|nr:hypothetical protein [Methylobacterium hispanicum]GJD87636.1 hypothetical protein BHAOGJBA_1141 [Methylobacterium hispanicum]